MLNEKFIENSEQWLDLMRIVQIDLSVPSIIKEIERLFLDLDPVIAGGVVSDSYLLSQELINERKLSNLDIFIPLGTDDAKVKEILNNKDKVKNLTEVKEEKIDATYSEELVNKRMSFTYGSYKCNLLFCNNRKTKIWDIDITLHQFMYLGGKVYATKLAIADIRAKLLRILNPVNGIKVWKRVVRVKEEYEFNIEEEGAKLLFDYIRWRKENFISKSKLKEYYYRLISQKKTHGRSLITYLLLNNNYQNDYFIDLLGSYQVRYDSNLNYERFINKIKDLKFKINTEIKDRQEVLDEKDNEANIDLMSKTEYKRTITILEQVSQLEFKEFLEGQVNKNRLKDCYKWHSPKIGKILENLKKFIDKLNLRYYQNYALNLCDQLLKLFNTRGPNNLEFKIVISQEAKDLLAISTDQSWTSCLELPKPDSQRVSAARIAANLQPNTLVVYITEVNGQEWLGRILIRLLRDGSLSLEKYYGEPVLKEVLIAKLEEIILDNGYQLKKGMDGKSYNFIEWQPYSDQGRVKKSESEIYTEYYIDYSLPSVIKKLDK